MTHSLDDALVEKVSEAVYDFLHERFPDGALPGGKQLFADDHLDAGFKHEAGCEELARVAILSFLEAAGVAELREDDETYEIGKRDGYEKAVQDIDLLTGGDGEYRYCMGVHDERHCPDAETMKAKISDRVAELREENERMRETLEEAMRRYPDARAALAWFSAASGLAAGEITQEVRDWADAALTNQGKAQG